MTILKVKSGFLGLSLENSTRIIAIVMLILNILFGAYNCHLNIANKEAQWFSFWQVTSIMTVMAIHYLLLQGANKRDDTLVLPWLCFMVFNAFGISIYFIIEDFAALDRTILLAWIFYLGICAYTFIVVLSFYDELCIEKLQKSTLLTNNTEVLKQKQLEEDKKDPNLSPPHFYPSLA